MPAPRHLFALTIALLLSLATGAGHAQQSAPPGKFDYYLLALSWSPAYCVKHRDDPAARDECGRYRGFVVHGLWPQNEDGTWPAFCRPVSPVPAARVTHEAMLMPNAELIEHEWDKHGSCTVLTTDQYFDALDRAFAGLRIPAPLARPIRPYAAPLAEVKRLFTAANPGLADDMFALHCAHGGWVEELRLCLAKDLKYRRCGIGTVDSCPAQVRFDPVTESGR